jgi:capsule polysaccharide export protein KpsE/RkpR
MEENKQPEGQYTIRDYYLIFRRYRKHILITTGLICITSIILNFFVLDLIFLSNTTLKTSTSASGLAGLLPEGIPDIGDLGGLGGGGSTAKELALYESILMSRRCVEETIIKFNLIERYEFKTMFDAVKHFRENVMELSKDKIGGTITIGIYEKDPVLAKEIVEFLVQQLNSINIEMKVQDAKNNRQFIEQRYQLAQADLRSIEDSLQFFQTVYGVAPDIQIQAAVKSQLELDAEVKSEEVKLEVLRKILSPDQPEIKAQENKISALREQLASMENTEYSSGELSLKGSPGVAMDFLRLKRNVEIQNKILSTLIPLYEQAKIEENRNTPSLLVLDPPNIPDKKIKPKRLTNVIILTFLTLMFAYAFFVLRTKWQAFRNKVA